jgi:hypothetical protein
MSAGTMARAASYLVLLGLLTSCRQAERAQSVNTVASSTPSARAAEPAVSGAAPAPSPRSIATESDAPLSLILTRDTWLRGSLTSRATSTVAPTRGGHERLNRMADELRALAAQCRCTSRPAKLVVDDQVPGWQLLSVLGLLNVSGFSQVKVEHDAESVHFELGGQAAPGSRTLRILGADAFLAGTRTEASADAVARLCGESACDGATLSVAEDAELDVWWHAANIVTGPARAQLVRLRLDSQPRPAVQLEPPRAAIQPIATIALANVQKRVMAEYAALYACLIEFPLPVADEPQAPLAFDLTIGADGVIQRVDVVGSAAPTEATGCLRSAFKAMVFHAPNFGSAKVRYPFARG